MGCPARGLGPSGGIRAIRRHQTRHSLAGTWPSPIVAGRRGGPTLDLRGRLQEEYPMRRLRMLALGASMLVLLSACSTGGGSKPTIKLGSDGFYESKLMAEIYGQTLEHNGYTVDRTAIGLGTRKVTAAALESGQFDLKPEYIGSGVAFYAGTATG